MELAVHMIQRAKGSPVRRRGSDRLPANDPLQPHDAHEPLDCISRDRDTLPVYLIPKGLREARDFAGAIDLEVVFEDAADRWP